MVDVTLSPVLSSYSSATKINSNYDLIETGFADAVSKSTGGTMGANLDMNSNAIFNLPTPVLSHNPITKGYFEDQLDLIGSTGLVNVAGISNLANGWNVTLTNATSVVKYCYASESTVADDAILLNARLAEVAAAGRGVLYCFGTFTIKSTIVQPKGVSIEGIGGFAPCIFRVTDDFGDTLRMGLDVSGSYAQGQYIRNIWFLRDHTYVVGVTTTLDNPCTLNPNAAHVRVYGGQQVDISSCWFYGNPYPVLFEGGTHVTVDRCVFAGVYWDVVEAGLRETKANIKFAEGTSNAFVTNARVTRCWIGGANFSGNRTVDFGGSTTPQAVDHQNVGARYGIEANAFEVLEISNNYIGGMAEHCIYIARTGNIGTGLVITNNYFDSSGPDSQIEIADGGNNHYIAGTVIKDNFFAGTGLTKHAIRIKCSANFGPLAISTIISGNYYRDNVGTAVKVVGAVGLTSNGNIYQNYNYYKLSTSNPDFASGMYLTGSGGGVGSTTMVNVVGETFGSGGIFEDAVGDAANRAKYGIYTDGSDSTFKLNADTHTWKGRSDGTLLAGDQTITPFEYTAFTPTVTSTGGTITTVGTKTCGYTQKGKVVEATYRIPITTNGTGSGAVTVGLPVTAKQNVWGSGREAGVSGKQLQAHADTASATTCLVRNYDDSYPAADGAVLVFGVTYEAL